MGILFGEQFMVDCERVSGSGKVVAAVRGLDLLFAGEQQGTTAR